MDGTQKTRTTSRWLHLSAPKGTPCSLGHPAGKRGVGCKKLGLRSIGIGLALSAATLAIDPCMANAASVAPEDARAAVARAAERVTAGQPAEAVDALREAMLAVWSAAPFDLMMIAKTTDPATGYRDYHPKSGTAYKAGTPLNLYIEPIGLQYKIVDGIYSMGMEADFLLLNEAGTVLGGQRNFAEFPFTFHVPSTAVYMTASFHTDSLPPDDYVLQLTVRDVLGGRSVTREVPFTITAPE